MNKANTTVTGGSPENFNLRVLYKLIEQSPGGQLRDLTKEGVTKVVRSSRGALAKPENRSTFVNTLKSCELRGTVIAAGMQELRNVRLRSAAGALNDAIASMPKFDGVSIRSFQIQDQQSYGNTLAICTNQERRPSQEVAEKIMMHVGEVLTAKGYGDVIPPTGLMSVLDVCGERPVVPV